MNYYPVTDRHTDRQKAMHMSPSCNTHRWAEKLLLVWHQQIRLYNSRMGRSLGLGWGEINFCLFPSSCHALIVSSRMEDRGRNCTLVFGNGLASKIEYATINPYAQSGTIPGSDSHAKTGSCKSYNTGRDCPFFRMDFIIRTTFGLVLSHPPSLQFEHNSPDHGQFWEIPQFSKVCTLAWHFPSHVWTSYMSP